MFKLKHRGTSKRCNICSKLTIKTRERHQWRRSGVFINMLGTCIILLSILFHPGFFLIGIHSTQGGPATTMHRVTKRSDIWGKEISSIWLGEVSNISVKYMAGGSVKYKFMFKFILWSISRRGWGRCQCKCKFDISQAIFFRRNV